MSEEPKDLQPVDYWKPVDAERTLTIRSKGMEIEIPIEEVFFSGGATAGEPRHAARNARTFLCGNCGERIPMSADHIENHHNAQRHKLVCGKAEAAALEHAQLLAEDQQRLQIAQAAQPHLQITGYGAIMPPPVSWRIRLQKMVARIRAAIFGGRG